MAHDTGGNELLKVWNDWSAGIGYSVESENVNGLYSASGILGLRGELRPAPHKFTTALAFTPSSHFQYFFETVDTSTLTDPYLYACRNESPLDDISVYKIDLRNAGFGASLGSSLSSTSPSTLIGQPAEYQGNWYIARWAPTLDEAYFRKLTTVATGAASGDVWNSPTASTNQGVVNHFVLYNFQLARGYGSPVATEGGASLLKLDGNPLLAGTDWGDLFPVGDKKLPVLGMAALEGNIFVAKRDGVYSFNDKGRSALIFPDFKTWPETFNSISIETWKTGLILPHSSGLFWYRPGNILINIGITGRTGTLSVVPSGPTDISSGRYHATVALGDSLYTVYQPNTTSTTAYIMVGLPNEESGFLPINWQVLGTTTLDALNFRAGIGVSTKGLPVDATTPRPSLWFSDADDLSYMILGPTGTPFRTRADTHRVTIAGNAYFSELFFPDDINITNIIVYTQDMAAGDSWQLSAIVDAGTDTTIGAPIVSNGRTIRDVAFHNIHRLMLHLDWTATSTANRVAPTIKRVELWGKTTTQQA